MLIQCPECQLQVSDKAISCPHCGYPIKDQSTVKRARKKPSKRMRLPNGFGQISEMKYQNLRKPFRAMVTVGKTDEGKCICKLLKPVAYFETYNEAYEALLEYNRNPFTLDSDMTVGELYEKWTEKYFKTVAESTVRRTMTAWKYCNSVKNIRVRELRGRHIKACLEDGCYEKAGEIKHTNAGARTMIKILFNNMLDYAVEYELIDKNYARAFKTSKEDRKELEENRERHIPYTDEEMKKLWLNINANPIIDIILIQCYTGWRPKELELLTLDDVDLENRTMKGGVKTKAGIDRIVPIHSGIFDLVKKRYENSMSKGSNYLFTMEGKDKKKNYAFEHYMYSRNLKLVVEELGLNPAHRPHDGRAHFITQAKKYNMDEYALKRIVGHDIDDITEAVYTTRDVSWLIAEMEKIKICYTKM